MAGKTLIPTRAPALPLADQAYGKSYQDRYSNILRLYFNQLDAFSTGLAGRHGGRFLNFPHISATGNANQYATGNNTPTIVSWDTADSLEGFTLNANNTATATYNGIYKIDYSLQVVNTDNAAHDVEAWLKIDGVNVARSGSVFTLSARKSTGTPSYLVAYSSVTFYIEAGQSVGLWWATDKAYSTTGPVDGVYMLSRADQTSPYTSPAVPAAIGSIVFVSALPDV